MTKKTRLKLTLVRSLIGVHKKHKASVAGLGIRRMHQVVIVDDTPCNRGMVSKASYLLSIEEV